MKFSAFDLREEAFSTSSRMRATVLSAKVPVVRTVITPVRLITPLRISSPARLSTGALSPVSAAAFTLVSPVRITPSSGTRSPGFTTIVSPVCTSSGETSSSAPSRTTVAVSGRMSISEEMLLRLLPTAIRWNHSPT